MVSPCARCGTNGTGGVALASVGNPTIQHKQRTGWRGALQPAEKRVWCATDGDELVGAVAMGPPLASDVDARHRSSC